MTVKAMVVQMVREAAATYGVPTVSTYDAFNGAERSEDPREKGHIFVDGQHTTDEGKAAMVDAFHLPKASVAPPQ